MRQITDLIEIETEFKYGGTVYDDWFNRFEDNILDYQAYFQNMEWTKEELRNISEQLVKTGRVFAEQQGFTRGGTSLVLFPSHKNKFGTVVNDDIETVIGAGPTGNLYSHIKSEVNGNKVHFYNDATNSRGQPYAGHMEYGFHDRGGNLVPARPFMRPAFYAVAEGSKGNFRSIMKNLLDNIWTAQGFRGISSLTFGRSAGSQSIFWKNPSQFSSKVGSMSRMRQISGRDFRQRMTTSRFNERKTGFNIKRNQRDWRTSHIPVADKYGNKIRSGSSKWGGLRSGRTAQQAKHQKEEAQRIRDSANEAKRVQRQRNRDLATGKSITSRKQDDSNVERDFEKEYAKIQMEKEMTTKYGYGYSSDYLGSYDDIY